MPIIMAFGKNCQLVRLAESLGSSKIECVTIWLPSTLANEALILANPLRAWIHLASVLKQRNMHWGTHKVSKTFFLLSITLSPDFNVLTKNVCYFMLGLILENTLVYNVYFPNK